MAAPWAEISIGIADIVGKYAGPSKSPVDNYSLTRPSQEQLSDFLGGFLTEEISNPSMYQGQMTYDISGTPIESALMSDVNGTPSYAYDPGAVSKEWQENYATPLMNSWRETVLPTVKEGFNIPGMFYSSARGRGVENAANTYYSQNVAPTLYSALQTAQERAFTASESAANRRASSALSLYQLYQAPLTAVYNEWTRMQEQRSGFTEVASNLATAQTQENVVFPYRNNRSESTSAESGLAGIIGGMFS